LVGGEDEIILDCYRLARWFHVSPEVFLYMPLSEVTIHMLRADQLQQEQQDVGDD